MPYLNTIALQKQKVHHLKHQQTLKELQCRLLKLLPKLKTNRISQRPRSTTSLKRTKLKIILKQTIIYYRMRPIRKRRTSKKRKPDLHFQHFSRSAATQQTRELIWEYLMQKDSQVNPLRVIQTIVSQKNLHPLPFQPIRYMSYRRLWHLFISNMLKARNTT